MRDDRDCPRCGHTYLPPGVPPEAVSCFQCPECGHRPALWELTRGQARVYETHVGGGTQWTRTRSITDVHGVLDPREFMRA